MLQREKGMSITDQNTQKEIYKNEELYKFLSSKTWELTEKWYASVDKSNTSGVYSSDDPDIITQVKEQNHKFHEQFSKLFCKHHPNFFRELEDWVLTVAKDEEHLRTPFHSILQEFFNTQEQYLDIIEEFIRLHQDEYSEEVKASWRRAVTQAMGKIITWFAREHHKYAESKLKAQQEMINELSTPVITLTDDLGLLPLVGDIDTARAQLLLESALEQCAEKGVSTLFIDLSGVVMIDTMVAQRLFHLVDALKLIGIKAVISGIRPEIAQVAVQLGLNFSEVSTTSTLKQTIKQHF
ncbi:RsbR, positive regulator of sigma-B [Bacillus thermotolerans]|nr:RsbR, positive regulator of sigma-B [Bacillus thermotolerans]